MNSLAKFSFEGHGVRMVVDEFQNPWFSAKDICAILDISNHRHAVSTMPDDERASLLLDASSRRETAVNESGLYRLIFRSNKIEAEKVRRWVFGEVLPSIRKTGSYDSRSTWMGARVEGKVTRRLLTDIVQQFIEYAKRQGSENADKYYMLFSKMVNDRLLEVDGKKPSNLRDHLNIVQLHQLSVAEQIISKSIVECISRQLHFIGLIA